MKTMRELLDAMKIMEYVDTTGEFGADFDLEQYRAPEHEEALYKGIPMEYRKHPTVIDAMREMGLRARYRGPRHDPQALTALKKTATSFALYPRS